MKLKKVPLRKCVGCGENKTKKELIRIVKDKEGNISIDFTGKVNGRGAYICNTSQCLTLAKKTKRLNKALETQIPEDIYEVLIKEIDANE